jgi:preprotein translocase subunit SecA
MTVRIESREQIDAAEQEMAPPGLTNVHYQHSDFDPNLPPEDLLAPEAVADAGQAVAAMPKVGRNDPCPCGSGKKYKQCHGRLA